MKYYTNYTDNDGFGSQYQKILQTYIFCKIHKLNFLYTPINIIEHNYDNDPDYINKIEKFINLKDNIENDTNHKAKQINYGQIIMKWFESNIDVVCNSEHMGFIKKCFWENKEKDIFKNNKINVAVHIRRPNKHDNRLMGADIPDTYFLNIIKKIRVKYEKNDKELQFHIYSQGDINNFNLYASHDTIFHINENIFDTFLGLICSEILVISPSSLSYVAALLSDGEIYYKKFWHTHKNNWIVN